MSELDIKSHIGKVVYIMTMDLQIKSGILTDCAEGGYYGVNSSDGHDFIFRQPKDIYSTEIEVRAEKALYKLKTKKRLNQTMNNVWAEIDKEAVEYIIEHFPEKLI